jgi:hypothetical protein
MQREANPAFVYEAETDVGEEKKERFTPQMPRRKKPVVSGQGKPRRTRACSFDFGISKPVNR